MIAFRFRERGVGVKEGESNRLISIIISYRGVGGKEEIDDVLGRRRKVCVIRPTSVLNRNLHPIPRTSTLPVVVLLEIEGILRESVPISHVMHRVDDVEGIRHSALDVISDGRALRIVVFSVEVEASRSFFGNVLTTEGDDVVAGCGSAFGASCEAVPAVG